MNTCRFCNEPSPCSGDCGELNLFAEQYGYDDPFDLDDEENH